jgi:hypothetical protein
VQEHGIWAAGGTLVLHLLNTKELSFENLNPLQHRYVGNTFWQDCDFKHDDDLSKPEYLVSFIQIALCYLYHFLLRYPSLDLISLSEAEFILWIY